MPGKSEIKLVTKGPVQKGRPWYGFDHERVREKFEGNPVFLCEMPVRGNTWAVYSVAEPNREKGHKDYMLLGRPSVGLDFDSPRVFVSGISKEEMEEYRYQNAVECLECGEVLYSRHRHDYLTCGCPNKTMIDGGSDYTRSGGADLAKTRLFVIDLLTGKKTRRKLIEK